jgi:hypothetical protein
MPEGTSTTIVHFISSVAHYWADCEKVVFLNLIFNVSDNFKFQCDSFSNKKLFHKGPVAANGALSETAYFIFGYFSHL